MSSAFRKVAGMTYIALDEVERLRNRLKRIAEIIEQVDTRCMASEGPVTATLQEMTQEEISRIYALATLHDEEWKP